MNHSVAELNNAGVSLVHSGDLNMASACFRAALKQALIDLKNTSTSFGQPFSDDTASPSTPSTSTALMGSCMEEENTLKIPAETLAFIEPATSPCAFLHSSPISVEAAPCAYAYDPLQNMTIVSAIVLCNIGIVYHLKSLEERSCEESAHKLYKARGLYEKAHMLLHESFVAEVGSTGIPVVDLVYMAVTNNLGQVTFDLSIFEASKYYYDTLRDFCISIVPARYADLNMATFLDQERNKFLLNALLRSYPTMAAAA